MKNNNIKIDVVVVTYNRLEKLKHALSCYEIQADKLQSIIVVNNNSTDGTKDFLKVWESNLCNCQKKIINLKENIGGAGGFATGQEYALKQNTDWIFVADDDAYVSCDFFAKFVNYLDCKQCKEKLCAICSTVYNMDGSISYAHRAYVQSKWNYFHITHSTSEDYNKSQFYCDLYSYVGTFLNANAMRKYGICNKELFIYADDSEHSLRISQYGKIICVTSLKIYHDSGQETEKSVSLLSWRDYYATRNIIYLQKKYRPFAAFVNSIRMLTLGCRKKNGNVIKMQYIAVLDAWKGKLGIHSKYRPGFTIK